MPYLIDQSIAFVGIPRCSSTSILECVAENFQIDEDLGQHVTLQQYKKKYNDIKYGITLIRNPVDRFFSACKIIEDNLKDLRLHLSEFKNKFYNNNSCGNYLEFCPQYSFLVSDVPLKIFKTSCSDSALKLLGLYGVTPHKNKSKRNYSSQFKSEIISYFSLDFFNDVYGLDIGIWKMLDSSLSGNIEIENPRDFLLDLKRGSYESSVFL